MSLPVIAIPEDTIKLYSMSKLVRIRPYLVGEEKLLLLAQETKDPVEVKKAVKQVIRRCTFDDVNPDTLPTFDLEWVFLQLRARSVSNIIEENYICQNQVSKTDANGVISIAACGGKVNVKIDIADIKMTLTEGHTNKVMLNDKIGVTLKYPTADVDITKPFDELLMTYIQNVFTSDGEVAEVSEQTPEELAKWVDTLSIQQVGKIKVFFETMPKLSHTFEFKCATCGYSETITLQGLSDFFE